MTITRWDGFAIIPKRCNVCNRLFLFEPFNSYVEEVGIEHYPLKQIRCKECSKKYKMTMSNGDMIRKMSDEELAKFMTDDFCEILCPEVSYCDGKCEKKLLDFLKEDRKNE